MKHRANINLLLSSIIWGMGLRFGLIALSRIFSNNALLYSFLWYGSVILSVFLYPLLAWIVLRGKTGLQYNIFFFPASGTMLATLGMFLFDAVQDKVWLDVAIFLVGAWLILKKLIPLFEGLPYIQKEWSLPAWEKLNELTWMSFLVLQFPELD
jgi:hypothetical protein